MAEIKISDLSIGDWVMYRDREWQVCSLYQFTDEVGLWRKDSQLCEYVADIEPIALTPEILEKNGFVDYEVGKGWYVLNVADDLRVWLHRNSHDWTFQLMKWSPLSTHEIGKVFIKHTHQLQHALRLAGVEKEIEV